MTAEPGDFEIIAGVGNEVFYFFGICRLFSRLKYYYYSSVVVVLCVLVLLAWSSTQVVGSILLTSLTKCHHFRFQVEPVVQSVILVERTAVGGATAQASSAEEVGSEITASFLPSNPKCPSPGERSSDSIFAATTRRGGEDMIGFKLSPRTMTSASG